MNELTNFANPIAKPETFDEIQHRHRVARQDPQLVLRRDQEAGDDQLPHVQARA